MNIVLLNVVLQLNKLFNSDTFRYIKQQLNKAYSFCSDKTIESFQYYATELQFMLITVLVLLIFSKALKALKEMVNLLLWGIMFVCLVVCIHDNLLSYELKDLNDLANISFEKLYQVSSYFDVSSKM